MSHIKLLLAEDCPLTRVSLKTTLAQPDLLLLGEAHDGPEVVRQAKTLRPSVILMDIGLPGLDGIAATQAILATWPDARVLMLTAREGEDDVLSAFRSGAMSYCLKDSPPETLLAAIRATAAGDCWVDPRVARLVLRALHSSGGLPPVALRPSPSMHVYAPQDLDEGLDDLVPLTERELAVLRLLAEGLGNPEIADRLGISLNTVKTHLKHIFDKLGVEDRTLAALKATKARLI